MTNRLLPYAVYVNRFKPYVDPLARPLDPPIDLPDDTNDIFCESDFPLDSFEAAPLKAPPPDNRHEQQQLDIPIPKTEGKMEANLLQKTTPNTKLRKFSKQEQEKVSRNLTSTGKIIPPAIIAGYLLLQL